MAVLLQKRIILAFESGVIVIKHWRMNNYLQKDRHKDTTYLEELATLDIDDKGAYTEKKEMYTECIQTVYTGKDSIGKDSIDKVRLGNNKRFTPPTVQEVRAYCIERGNEVDSERFIDFYESKGWMVGKNKMKDWKAAVRNWERKENADKLHKDRFGYIDEWEKK